MAEYCELKTIFGVEGELEVEGSHATWRNCMWDVLGKGWREEEVSGKLSLKSQVV